MNDIPSSPAQPSSIAPEAEVHLLLEPQRSALLAGHPNVLHVLVRVQAPERPMTLARGKPQHLALVIDRSGSMSGQPLHEALACARHVIGRLGPDDEVALFAYDDRVTCLAPLTPARERAMLVKALEKVHEGGCTNLHGGWRAGAEALLPGVEAASLARVILLSDGNANAGETDPDEMARQSASLLVQGVSTSTYGLGHDFNEALMVAIAQQGGGSHYYGATAADLFEPFAEEFDLLANLCVRDLSLSVGTHEGIEVEVMNAYPRAERADFPAWRLPDLAWGSEAWGMLKITVPMEWLREERLAVLQVAVTGTTQEGRPLGLPDAQLSLPVLPAQAFAAIAHSELVERRLLELEAARLLTLSREAALNGNWETVQSILAEATRRLGGHEWVKAILAQIARLAEQRDSRRFGKEAMYSSFRLQKRLADKAEAMALDEAAKPAFLRRKKAQGRAEFERRGDEG
jgi:Ca-activated chloride channel family protein